MATTETDTYSGTNPETKESASLGTVLVHSFGITCEAGENLLSSDSGDTFVMDHNGAITEIIARDAAGNQSRTQFTSNNTFVDGDSLVLDANPSGGNVTVTMTKNEQAFLSMTLVGSSAEALADILVLVKEKPA